MLRVNKSLFVSMVAPLFMCLTSTITAHAAIISSSGSTIKEINSYTDISSGDVAFTIHNAHSSCFGYWIRGTDAGAKNSLAVLMMAFASSKKVTIASHDDQIWTGSRNRYCRVHGISVK